MGCTPRLSVKRWGTALCRAVLTPYDNRIYIPKINFLLWDYSFG